MGSVSGSVRGSVIGNGSVSVTVFDVGHGVGHAAGVASVAGVGQVGGVGQDGVTSAAGVGFGALGDSVSCVPRKNQELCGNLTKEFSSFPQFSIISLIFLVS